MTEKKTNRLIHERSPYLRQHASNPVQWYPWGEEAFAEARKQNKPIFLSIGYSTCHWCHVMERESFADNEVARLLNGTFIPIKVDREERPDIDDYYMAVCQLLTGSGGWPLTILTTPEKEPFFAGTYFPKESRFGLSGLKDLIARAGEAWKSRPADLQGSAEKIRAAMEDAARPEAPQKISIQVLNLAYQQLRSRFDEEDGGFGTQPKFPTPHQLTFLLRYADRAREGKAREMAEKTLRAMRRGGIWDHLGFGFHRYSTDSRWLVPHFEKMLYDQALLAIAYVEAYQLTAKAEYAQTVNKIMTYVGRNLTSEEGGFFSAEDADSEGKEGRYYLWTEAEIRSALTAQEAGLAVRAFNIQAEGNFAEAGSRGHGKNILYLGSLEDHPGEGQSPLPDPPDRLFTTMRQKLFKIREKRQKPFKDEKVLTDWNGLMIAALAKASRALGKKDYAAAAGRAARFIRWQMTRNGQLYHRYAEGELAIAAFLDDFAFLVWGLLELHETTFDFSCLEWALQLAEESLVRFWDDREGGFFLTSQEAREVPLRRKNIYDGAVPSGNSVMALNLLRLGRLAGRADFEDKTAKIFEAFSGPVAALPMAYTQLMCALDFAKGPASEVVIVGHKNAPDTRALLRALHGAFVPNKVVHFKPEGMPSRELMKLAPYIEPMGMIRGKAAAYVCSHFRCGLPTTDPDQMLARLKKP